MKLPIFARGTTEKIALAIEKKIITYPAYIMNTDTNMYGFLDSEGAITYFAGNNKALVQRVDTLPAVEDGDTEVLYLMGEVLYSFDGEAYIPTYQTLKTEFDQFVTDSNSQFEVMSDRIEVNETSISNLDTRLRNAGARIGTLETEVEALKTKNDELVESMDTVLGTVDTLNTKVTEVVDSMQTVTEHMDTVDSVLLTHKGRLDTIDTAIEGLDSRTDVVEEKIAANDEAVAAVQQRVETAEGNISTLSGNLETVSGKVDAHTEELALHDSAISHLTGEVYDIQQKIEEMEKTGGSIEIDDGSGTTQTVTVEEYIVSSAEDSIAKAKQYTDEQIQLQII